MRTFLLTVLLCAAMIAIVPLMVWGGTGDWRHALLALRQYAKILAGLLIVGGGFGLLMALMGWIN